MSLIRALRHQLVTLGGGGALTVAAVACLAIGAAAVTALLTLTRATLLRPLPFPEAERLTRVWVSEPTNPRIDLSYPLLRALRDEISAFATVEATARTRLLLLGDEGGVGGRRVEGEGVTAGYFTLLGLRPAAGRYFSAEEQASGERGPVVISEVLARERFGSAAGAVGRRLPTSEGPLVVVGVAPVGFTGTVEDDAGEIELWVPIDAAVSPERRERWDVGGIWVLALLRDDVGARAAAAELESLAARLARAQPATHGGRSLAVEPLAENWRSGLRRGTALLLAAAAALLLIAVLNVAALLLARAIDQRSNRAVRRALGASSWALLRGVLLETAGLMAVGGGLGALIGCAALPRLLEAAGVVLPAYVRATPDLATAAAVAAVLAVAGMVAAAVPALAAVRSDPGMTLREEFRGGGPGRGGERLWSTLVVGEVALALMLTFAALVLARSVHALGTDDLGFRTAGVLRFGVFGVAAEEEREARLAAWRRVRDGVATHAGVERAALVWPTVPIWGAVEEAVRWPGMPGEESGRGLRAGVFGIDEELFPVLGIRLIAGRPLRDDEAAEARVAVVSRSLADRLGGAETAIGRELVLADGNVTVVGVASDVRLSGARDETESNRYTLYLPLANVGASYVTVLAATAGDPEALAAPLAREIGRLAPDAALDWVGSLSYWLGQRYVDTRFAPLLAVLFAGGALLIAAVGLFALASAGVGRRRVEIGLRMAVGATPLRVAALVLRRGIGLVALGVALGALVGWPIAGVLAGFVHRLSPRDPWSLLAAGGLLVVVAAVASALPARRAARMDPLASLRRE
jgi:predicted permease